VIHIAKVTARKSPKIVAAAAKRNCRNRSRPAGRRRRRRGHRSAGEPAREKVEKMKRKTSGSLTPMRVRVRARSLSRPFA
jgi:hypothetical protein